MFEVGENFDWQENPTIFQIMEWYTTEWKEYDVAVWYYTVDLIFWRGRCSIATNRTDFSIEETRF